MGQDGKAHIERFSKLQAAIREFAIQNSYLIEIIGDPSRSNTTHSINGLDWQIGLSTRVETKGLYVVLANQEAPHVATA